jgi:8-oxo-dGTP pyrophosphatase MutT (NUDIX family)
MDNSPFPAAQPWRVHDRFLQLNSRWLTLIGEHLQDQRGEILEYWRIEKADSVIVLPIRDNTLLLPAPSYRPGVGQVTLDFPGGRVSQEQSPEQAATLVLQRELGIEPIDIVQLHPLNTTGWAVNSSFCNQRLYGFVAHLNHIENTKQIFESIPVTPVGIQELLQTLTCLQCRAVLLEWWLHSR